MFVHADAVMCGEDDGGIGDNGKDLSGWSDRGARQDTS